MKTILMCPPTYFDIEYEINPWMHKDNQVKPELAKQQWQKLYDIYTHTLGWDVQLIDPVNGLPDMVFTANGGLVYRGTAVLPRFRYPERQGETEHFKHWFEQAGYQTYMPKHDFEGEGDAFVWRDEILFGGHPFRSDIKVHKELAGLFKLEPVSLQLTDPRFYHLDTCFTIIDQDTISVFPKAFSPDSLAKLRKLVPNLIEADEDDAVVYGLNAQVLSHQAVVIPADANNLVKRYQKLGLKVYETPISEFQKSGGGVKCLTLELR
jgi:N-dimethylarginine dimethylaminohydrolase